MLQTIINSWRSHCVTFDISDDAFLAGVRLIEQDPQLWAGRGWHALSSAL